MKSPAIGKMRQKLARDEPVYGLWVTLESGSISEMGVALGLDWIVVDAEHGHLDWRDILEHIRATVRSDTVVLVRIAELSIGLVKRALDIGADGVVVPWMEEVEQLREAVSFAHYPPQGLRGIGAERATCWGQCFAEHVEEAEENVLVVPIIESVKGGRNIHQLLEVDGVEIFFFGPADYSSTAGSPGQWEGPGVAEMILETKDAIREAGKHCGVVATDNENLDERLEQGFRMLAIGIDGGLMLRSLRGAMAHIGRDRRIAPGFTLESTPLEAVRPLERPPEAMRPDRPEVMNAAGEGEVTVIAPGLTFEALVGSHNQARNLTTGLSTFAPGVRLPYHTHPYTESVTLLSGEAIVEVEGRMYSLEAFDNVTIPPNLPHSAMNPGAREPAVFHVAVPATQPARTPVESFFPRRRMAADAGGREGGERVTRHHSAPRYEAGPNTSFIDFFNSDLIPGIEMSGGYGLFQHQGRLPAHIHDFDESISIVEGTASCIVEGRRYTLGDNATALQPRGRVHYFINETHEPMAMVWVYAGPVPERLVVDEACATVEGNPWK
jgi:2-keto-3-deoxy-L-rhamnonate aldolase RhmA/quercetin dioxygenase-like cupin family protein